MVTTSDIKSLPNHIRNKILVTSCGCWVWLGELTPNGYGRGWYKGIRTVAHRIVYGLLINWADDKYQLDHQCCNRSCVNPNHLTPVTHKRNCKLRDMRNRQQNDTP